MKDLEQRGYLIRNDMSMYVSRDGILVSKDTGEKPDDDVAVDADISGV